MTVSGESQNVYESPVKYPLKSTKISFKNEFPFLTPDTTFVGFKSVCSTERNYMFMTNPGNEDLQHPISVERIYKINSTEDSLAFIHRPDLG